MATKVSLINMKGGVGKSTLTANLAWYLAGYFGKHVLVIDLDPQFNVSQYILGIDRYLKLVNEDEPTIWDIFEINSNVVGKEKRLAKCSDAVIELLNYKSGGKVAIVPSQLELSLSLRKPAHKELRLKELITQVEDENNFDFILVDCSPTESLFTTAAYLISDYILVPVKPEFLSSIGLPLLKRSIDEFMDSYPGQEFEVAGIAFNFCSDYSPEEDKAKTEVRKIADKFQWYVFKQEIRESKSLAKGAREGKPLWKTSYARSEQKDRMKIFVEEFLKRVETLEKQKQI